MPGQKISSMTLVSDLQDIDQFPIARNGSTYKIRGLSLASRTQLIALSARVVNEHQPYVTIIPELSSNVTVLSATSIFKPTNPNHGQVLAYDRSTASWVASSVSILPTNNPPPFSVLTYDNLTTTWIPSAVSNGSLGVNQRWYNVTNNRLSDVTYTNSTPLPICVQVYYVSESGAPLLGSCTAYINLGTGEGVTLYGTYGSAGNSSNNLNFIVPPGWNYKVNTSFNGITNWSELR